MELDFDLGTDLDLGSSVYDWIDSGLDVDRDGDGDVNMREEKAESPPGSDKSPVFVSAAAAPSQQAQKRKQEQKTSNSNEKEQEFEETIIPPMPKELVSRVYKTFGMVKGSAFQVNALLALQVDVLTQTDVIEQRSLAGPQRLTHVFWPDKHSFIMTRLSRSK